MTNNNIKRLLPPSLGRQDGRRHTRKTSTCWQSLATGKAPCFSLILKYPLSLLYYLSNHLVLSWHMDKGLALSPQGKLVPGLSPRWTNGVCMFFLSLFGLSLGTLASNKDVAKENICKGKQTKAALSWWLGKSQIPFTVQKHA